MYDDEESSVDRAKVIGAARIAFGLACNVAPRATVLAGRSPAEDLNPTAEMFVNVAGTRAAALGALQYLSSSADPAQRATILRIAAAVDGVDTLQTVLRYRRDKRIGPLLVVAVPGAALVFLQLSASLKARASA